MLAVLKAGLMGESDRLLADLAQELQGRGLRVLGAVQENTDRPDGKPCDMDLRIVPSGQRIRISQSLGSGSTGCRLNPEGVEAAAGLLAVELAKGADLLVINKFGKQEAAGAGFRALIGEALAQGVPVITAVKSVNAEGFEAFAQGLATPLPNDRQAVLDWLELQLA